jgi:hypothetical protein
LNRMRCLLSERTLEQHRVARVCRSIYRFFLFGNEKENYI